MASLDSKRDMTRRILGLLVDAGGPAIESFLDPYEKLRIANMFVDQGRIDRAKMVKKLRAMEQQELISIREKKGEIEVKLLERGTEKALRYKVDEITIPKQKDWDHKWRLILFDIPEEHKSARNLFRQRLEELGFIQLQHSAYIHPYECHNEIEFIRAVLGIKQYIKMLIVDKIEGEAELRKTFDL